MASSDSPQQIQENVRFDEILNQTAYGSGFVTSALLDNPKTPELVGSDGMQALRGADTALQKDDTKNAASLMAHVQEDLITHVAGDEKLAGDLHFSGDGLAQLKAAAEQFREGQTQVAEATTTQALRSRTRSITR